MNEPGFCLTGHMEGKQAAGCWLLSASQRILAVGYWLLAKKIC